MEKMVAAGRNETAALIRRFKVGREQTDFKQVVRRLEHLMSDRGPVGEGVSPEKEAVRFHGNFNLGFPDTDIQSIDFDPQNKNRVDVTVNFTGIGGFAGPLPEPYNEFILKRYFQKDRAIHRFFDNFNHRLISLFYKVFKLYSPASDSAEPETDRFAGFIFSFLGLGRAALRNKMAASDRAILGYCGVYTSRSTSGYGLEHIITRYFKVPVSIQPATGQWKRIPERQMTRLGEAEKNSVLGESFTLGDEAWVEHSQFDIRLEPLTWAEYQAFLPCETGFSELCDMIRYYVGDEFDFRIVLGTKSEEIRGFRLGRPQGKAVERIVDQPRLGWNMFLVSGAPVSGIPEAIYLTR